MKTVGQSPMTRVGAVALTTIAMLVTAAIGFAKSYDDPETVALVQVLSESKISMIDGLRQVSHGREAPISAKFEFDDNHKLSLSIYTAEKGLATDPENNVLKEYSGNPVAMPWTPEAEVFKGIPQVARASAQLTLSALAKHSLADFIVTARKQQKGMVFSAIPEVHNHRAVLVVLSVHEGKVNEHRYDLATGHALP
jgi:hypothetical protein